MSFSSILSLLKSLFACVSREQVQGEPEAAQVEEPAPEEAPRALPLKEQSNI